MELQKFQKLLSPRTVLRHYEALPLAGAVVFGATLLVSTGIYMIFTRTDAKVNRSNKDPQHLQFANNDRITQAYWHDKPKDTAPDVIKSLRFELTKDAAE